MPQRDRIAAVAVAAVLFAAPLLLGGAPRWAALALAFACLGCAALHQTSARQLEQRPPLLSLLLAAIALTAGQVIPLPSALVEIASPAKVELARANAEALAQAPPGWLALSYDVPATLVELAKLVGYAAFALACLRLSSSERRRRQLAMAVGAAASLVAGLGLAHLAVDAERLYGVYTPLSEPPPFFAPLLNENHLAGYLGFATPLCVALAISSQHLERALWFAGAGLCASVALLTQSRGGAVSLVAGLVVGGSIYLGQRHNTAAKKDVPRSVMVSFGAIAVCAVVLIAALTAGGVAEELSTTDTSELSEPDSKFAAWSSASQLIDRHTWTGVGRGAFEFAFTSVHPSGAITFSHLENEYLQAVVDWGVPGGLLIVVLLFNLIVYVVRHRAHTPIQAGALGGLAGLAVHNVVDFNLQLSAVALSAIAVTATLVPTRLRRTRSSRKLRRQAERLAALAAGAVAIVLATSPMGETASADGRELADAPVSPELADRAIELMNKHPADYLIIGHTARALLQKGDPRAIAVINRALAMSPDNAGLHHLAARILVRSQKPRQALIEYRLALQVTPRPRRVLADLLADFPELSVAVGGMPTEARRGAGLVMELAAVGRTDAALEYARALESHHPRSPDVLRAHARVALGNAELAESAEAARRLYDAEPNTHAALLLARALREKGQLRDAESVLQDAVARARKGLKTEELAHLSLVLGDLWAESDRPHEARAAYRDVLAVTHRRSFQLAAYRRLATIEDALGNMGQAERERAKARTLQKMQR